MAEIVCSVCIFHLTWLVSLHYLVKGGCSKFYLTLDLLQSDCSDLLSKWRGHRNNFLAQRQNAEMQTYRNAGNAQVVRRRFFMFQENTSTHQHAIPSLSWSEREMREMHRRLSACVRVQGTFRVEMYPVHGHKRLDDDIFEHEFW